MKYLLDTNVFITAIAEGQSRLADRVQEASNAREIGLSDVVFAELALGVARGGGGPWAHRDLDVIDAGYPHVAFDANAARRYGWLGGCSMTERRSGSLTRCSPPRLCHVT